MGIILKCATAKIYAQKYSSILFQDLTKSWQTVKLLNNSKQVSKKLYQVSSLQANHNQTQQKDRIMKQVLH